MKIRNMVFTAVFAAVLCVVSPLTIPIGPIPLSLATFAIYLAASTLDWKYGTLSVVVYVALGLVGLPVFSRFEGGIQKLVGPSGGFIAGYILMALAAGLILSRYPRKRWL
jgi:biotin transport system substrate-specific component